MEIMSEKPKSIGNVLLKTACSAVPWLDNTARYEFEYFKVQKSCLSLSTIHVNLLNWQSQTCGLCRVPNWSLSWAP